MVYNNIFASTYNYYSKFKNEYPGVASICVVFVCQVTLALLLVGLIGEILNRNLFLNIPNKLYALPFLVVWLVLLFKIYSKERISSIIEEFNSKSVKQRRIWGIITVGHFVCPTILFLLLLLKR
jgi:hypothetical protein